MVVEKIAFVSASFLFLVGLTTGMVSFISNLWFSVDYKSTLTGDLANSSLYTEGLLSVCWFGDCESLSSWNDGGSFSEVYFARVMMIIALTLDWICVLIKGLKISVFQKEFVSQKYVRAMGITEVCAGAFTLSAPAHYFQYNDLANKKIGTFEYGFYNAWVSAVTLISSGVLTLIFAKVISKQISPIQDESSARRLQIDGSDGNNSSQGKGSIPENKAALFSRRATF